MKTVNLVFDRLQQVKLTVILTKCAFGRTGVQHIKGIDNVVTDALLGA